MHFRARYELERINEYDNAVAMYYGSVIEKLPPRNILSRKVALLFVAVNFYRRLLFPIAIVLSQFTPIINILLVLYINLFYTAFMLSYHFFNDVDDQRYEAINEILILSSIYIFMLQCEDYIAELNTRDIVGYMSISIIALVFLVNLAPILVKTVIGIKNSLKKLYYKKRNSREMQIR